MNEPIRILIADDHALFRDGLRALFSSLPNLAVVGQAATGMEAIALAEQHQPDVVLMDIQMPGVNGIEATRQIVQTSPHIGVIIVTMFEDNDSVPPRNLSSRPIDRHAAAFPPLPLAPQPVPRVPLVSQVCQLAIMMAHAAADKRTFSLE